MIVIDTHVLIWWINNPEKLSKKAAQLIDREKKKDLILISSISVWEIYLLIKKNKLNLLMDTDSWLDTIESLPFIQFIPIDNKIAAKSVILPGEFHSDPADRLIVATARERGLPLVTSDERIREYSYVETIW